MDYEDFDQAAEEKSTNDVTGPEQRSPDRLEDEGTEIIESQTSQMPSSAYLGAAVGIMAMSAIFKLFGKHHAALFVGQWAAPFLLIGIYNKMLKPHGSEAESRSGPAAGSERITFAVGA